MVEHDEQVIRSADKIIEIGPKPGLEGGKIIFQGGITALMKSKKSITSKWLNKKDNNKKKNGIAGKTSTTGLKIT